MVLMLSLFLSFGMIFGGGKWIKKNANLCYLICLLLSGMTVAAVWSGVYAEWSVGLLAYPIGVFTQGGLAGALFLHVMFAAAVKNGSVYMRKVMPIRGELSIIASILTLGHNIAFGKRYFGLLFTRASEMRTTVLMASVCSLVMMMIMIPLFVMSFPAVRRRMKAAKWKRIQRLAYGFYGLMYLHVMLLNVPFAMEGKTKGLCNVILYTLIFSAYFVMRVLKIRKLSRGTHLILRRVIRMAAMVWAAVWIGIGCASYVGARSEREAAGSTAASAESESTDNGSTAASAESESTDNGSTAASAESESTDNDITFTDGTFTGSALGYNGKLKVAVTVESGRISDVTLKSSVEDEPYLSKSLNRVIPKILEQNGTQGIDSVSGATSTAIALLEAVEDALQR